MRARLAVLLNAIAPNTMAGLSAAVDRTLLPHPDTSPLGDTARRGVQIEPGAVESVLSERTRREFHQPDPAWA
jgi:hypothetical protein